MSGKKTQGIEKVADATLVHDELRAVDEVMHGRTGVVLQRLNNGKAYRALLAYRAELRLLWETWAPCCDRPTHECEEDPCPERQEKLADDDGDNRRDRFELAMAVAS